MGRSKALSARFRSTFSLGEHSGLSRPAPPLFLTEGTPVPVCLLMPPVWAAAAVSLVNRIGMQIKMRDTAEGPWGAVCHCTPLGPAL